LDSVRGQLFTDRRVRTYEDELMLGEVRLPALPGVEPSRDTPLDWISRRTWEHPLLTFGGAAAGALLGAGMSHGVLGRIGGGVLGATIGAAAGLGMAAIASAITGRESPTTEAHVRQVPGAGTTPRHRSVGEQIRVMDWNVHQLTGVHGDVGYDRGAVDAIAATVAREHPDVLVLQEVSQGAVEVGRRDELAILAERLGATDAVLVPNGIRAGGRLKGNAVLTFGDARIQDARGLFMPDPSNEAGYFPRSPADVIVTTAGGTDVRILNSHLSGTGKGSGGTPGSDAAQERQLVPLAATVDAWKGPTILTGDFNVNGGTGHHAFERRVLASAGLRDVFAAMGIAPDDERLHSFSSTNPTRNIDRAYVSTEFGVTGARVLQDPTASAGSDHLAVVTDLVVRS